MCVYAPRVGSVWPTGGQSVCRGVADAWFEPEDPGGARLSQQSHLYRRASPVEPMVVAALCQPTPQSSQSPRPAVP
jgi:hypothetical protein